MVKLNILSDWNQQLDAYNAPKVLIKKLMNKHKNLSFLILMTIKKRI